MIVIQGKVTQAHAHVIFTKNCYPIFFVDVCSNAEELQHQGKETVGDQTTETGKQEPSAEEARKKVHCRRSFPGLSSL